VGRGQVRRTKRLRGIDFHEALEALEDPLNIDEEDREHSSLGEERINVIGMSRRRHLLHVTIGKRGNTIRIISARRATARERHEYEEG
jgi:uncharacterized DUF497 family protein